MGAAVKGRLRARRERVLQRRPRRGRYEGRRDRHPHRGGPGPVCRDRAAADRDHRRLRGRRPLSAPIHDHPARGAGRAGASAARRPPSAGRGADVPGRGVLHPADPRPRALSLPGVRRGSDPGSHVIPLADRLRGPRAGQLRQPLRDPADPVLQEPGGHGLARDGRGDPLAARRDDRRRGPCRGLRLDRDRAPAPGDPSARRGGADRCALGAGRGIDGTDPHRTGGSRPGGRPGDAGRSRHAARRRRRTRRRRRATGGRGWVHPAPANGAGHGPVLGGTARRTGIDRPAAALRPRPDPEPDAGPLRPADRRGRRSVRPTRPVAARGHRGGRAGPPDVQAVRALPDAFRRGLPRPDRDRVPAGLALRDAALDLRVHPPPPREVRHGGRADRRRRRPGHRPARAGVRRPRHPRRAGVAGPLEIRRPGRRPVLRGRRGSAPGLRPRDARARRDVVDPRRRDPRPGPRRAPLAGRHR